MLNKLQEVKEPKRKTLFLFLFLFLFSFKNNGRRTDENVSRSKLKSKKQRDVKDDSNKITINSRKS
ncbi:hypothetical protein AAHE18_12G127700 [Arachis hypogaea]